jgi:organic radical activating enzyme
MESFYTIQGEGYHTGTAAYFIRTGGCDVGCVWCDVKESWDASAHPRISIKNLLGEVKSSGTEVVVITGGEPMMHDLDILTRVLQTNGLRTHIETSGTHPVSGEWDWVCFSPKKFKKPLEEYYTISHELKVIVYHPSDLKWAEDHARRMHPRAQLYLQPEWSKKDEATKWIIDYVKDNPHWKISLQTHKYMDIP